MKSRYPVGVQLILFMGPSPGSQLSHPINHTTQGMREYVVIYGTARVTEGGAVPLLQRLAPIYLGPGAEYPPASTRNITGLWHQNHAGTLHWDWSVDSTSHWLTMSHH